MLTSYSSISAQRHPGGVCRGTFLLKATSQNVYAMALGSTLRMYESVMCYEKGDFPLSYYIVVGSSASASNDNTSFSLVTNQGTHVDCTAPTLQCCTTWLTALQAGLTLSFTYPPLPTTTALPPSSPQRTTPTRRQSSQRLSKFFQFGRGSQALTCVCCGKSTAAVTLAVMPFPQYGHEKRMASCADCRTSQGLLAHVQDTLLLYQAAEAETLACNQARNAAAAVYTTGSSDGETTTSSSSSGGTKEKWVAVAHDESAAALTRLVQSLEFQHYATTSCTVQEACQKFTSTSQEDPKEKASEFMEALEEAATHTQQRQVAALKTQAFRAAGSDMGTAMKLLLEHTCNSNNSNEKDTQVLTAVLDFFLDLCQHGEVAAVAFFWPQLCHVHLRMLPATTAMGAVRVQVMEHFLVTVATQHSIHLALQLVWSHYADLEESMAIPSNTSTDSTHATSSTTTSTTTTATPAKSSSEEEEISPACRLRRFAVLRFVCELESLLFDFEGGWGGGSVAAGALLKPTAAQCTLLNDAAKALRSWRPRASSTPTTTTPEARLQITRNADYFSCTISFSRRLAEIAEKLRTLEVHERSKTLEQELNLLNASGAMGGDPLNRMSFPHLTRVVRVPSQEGHVFRSKERTPVLLLMEVIDEGMAEIQQAEQERAEAKKKQEKEEQVKATKAARQAIADSSSDLMESPKNSETKDDNTPLHEEDPLVGADEGMVVQSPSHKALMRFDSDGELLDSSTRSATPKSDVAKIVNSVATEHLIEITMPDISETPEEWKAKTERQVETPVETTVVAEEEEPEQTPAVDNEDKVENVDSDNKSGAPEVKGTTELHGMTSTTTEPLQDAMLPRRGSFNRLVSVSRSASGDMGDSAHSLAPTGDIRRAVLTTIMMRGLQGNTIAAGAADAVQRSLKELERKRATELLVSDGYQEESVTESVHDTFSEHDESTTNQKIACLGLNSNLEEAELASRPSEEDEVLEAIRLILIQNRVAQGQLSPADAAKVLQHTSLNPINASKASRSLESPPSVDESECPTIDAGDVDSRLVGCGPLPPAVLQAMTLWKGGVVSHAELLELVKKDIEFVKHSVLVDAENLTMLKENSAFWARFAFGERWAEKKARIGSASPQGTVPGWDMMGVIVKSNDDLRQEAFVMQLIDLSKEAFELAGLELWVSPYTILATGRTTGVIECVRNAMSFDALKKRPGYGRGGLREHLQRMAEFTADPGEAFKSAQRNFVRSLAAYSLISYFFLVKDRHNGNLLLDTAGHVIHIDFGFVFGIAPGGSFSLEMSTPFKLTEEMLDVMGGLRSPLFSEFVTLFCCGFLALQSHRDTFMTLIEITSKQSTFKCFDGRDTEDVVAKTRERFCPDMGKEDTVSFALDLIKQATTSYGTKQYDLFQYITQGVVA